MAGATLANKLTKKIKDDYGSVTRFLKMHGINKNTYYVVVCGHGKSEKVTNALIDNGYIKSADELDKVSA